MNYNTDPAKIIAVLIIAVFSIILHELAHGAVAYLLGDRTAKDAGRLTLNPLKHIDPYMSILVPVVLYILKAPVFGGAKPVPIDYRNLKGKEWGMALVAIAGPLTNFLIALVSFLIGYLSGVLQGYPDGFGYFIFAELVYLNLGLMLFNLIPVPPLDGSRVLYALSPDFIRQIMGKMETYGIIIVYALILIFGNVLSVLMVNGMNGIVSFFYMLVGQ